MTEQKTLVLTGASRGIGHATVKRFGAEGWRVLTCSRQPFDPRCPWPGGEANHIQIDLADPKKTIEAIETIKGKINGRLHALVNNAGIIGTIANTVDLTQTDYQLIIDINQLGVYLGMQAVLPSMIKAGGGSIVNISSIAGMIACVGSPNLAYVGSKFAVRGMTKQVAAEYGPQNVRCNSVHPGYILTPMMVAATDENGGGAGDMIPLKRMAAPKEVSELVMFLASEESSFITGMEHVIDGGMTAC